VNKTETLHEVVKMELQKIKQAVVKFIKDEEGLTIVEYAVAGGLITVAVVAAFIILGGNVNTRITSLGCAVMGQTC
jgi:pilus assembly protein Flp/PilA